jgi:hypothetical protein
MRIQVVSIFLLLIAGLSLYVPGQKRDDGVDGVILFRPDIKFILKEPDGWVLDTQAGATNGVEAVLYPKGSSWKNAVAVMYARVVHKDETQKTVEKVASDDIADFMKQSKESTVKDSPSLPTRDKKQAVVKVFYDAANKNYESVAFIDNDKVVVVIALSSRTKAEYDAALPAFQQLVASYFEVKLFGYAMRATPDAHV